MKPDQQILESRRHLALALVEADPRGALDRLIEHDPLLIAPTLGAHFLGAGVCASAREWAAELYAALLCDGALHEDLGTWLDDALAQRVARVKSRELTATAADRLARALGVNDAVARTFWGLLRTEQSAPLVLRYLARYSSALQDLFAHPLGDAAPALDLESGVAAESVRRSLLQVALNENARRGS